MNAAALIRHLAQAGIRLSPNGDRLRVEAKPGTVTSDLRAIIANRKSDLLAELDQAHCGERESRQAKVEAELASHPERRVAFDVTGAALNAANGHPVSVMLAVRHGEQILSGELLIPRGKWDLRGLLATVETAHVPKVPS